MRRTRSPELMDAPDADPGELQRSLDFIERVNRRLGYTRATIGHLDRLTGNWPQTKPLRLLDIATGSADVPRAVCAWANGRKHPVSVVGIDLHEHTLEIARAHTRDPRVTLIRADALSLPFDGMSFDVVLCSMFLHHLDEDATVRVIREADRVARHGVILADLLRSRRALAWITLFTLFSNPMVKHDARVSVRQAYRRAEMIELAGRAGAGYLRFHRHFGHRFVMAGTKPGDNA